MQFETNPRESTRNATSPNWLAPLTVLIAWLVSLLNHIANLKRIRATTHFKPHWTESWTDLRRLEWHRDQMLAQGAALLLAGKTLDDAEAVLSDPPEHYGGPRPATPFQMQRRFLAIAEWLKDPEGHIRRHAARIAKRMNHDLTRNPLRRAARATSPTCVASEGGNAPAPLVSLSRYATGGGGMRAPCAHDGGGLSANRARAPPAHPTMFEIRLQTASPAPPARSPSHVPHRSNSRKRPSLAIDTPDYARTLQ